MARREKRPAPPASAGAAGADAWGGTLESVPDGIVVVDDRGIIVYANANANALSGYPAGELIGAPVELLVPERLHSAHVAHRRDYHESPRSRAMGVGMELACRRKDGSEVPVDVSLSPIETQEGSFVLASIRDVSHRRVTERALVEAEARYRSVFENAVEGMFVTTLDGRYVATNPALAAMLGYASPDELMAAVTDVRGLYAIPEQRDAFVHELGTRGAVSGFEYQVKRKDGSAIWVSENVRSLLDTDGRLVGFEGTSIDISERRRSAEMLGRHGATLEAVAFTADRFLRASRWQDGIDEVLARLGEATGVDVVVVYENHLEGDRLLTSGRYEWCSPGTRSEIEHPTNQDFPWIGGGFERWAELLGSGRAVHGHARDFPESERVLFEEIGIRSTAAMPVFAGDAWWGYIGFDTCREEREWSSQEIDVLRAAADALGAAIARQNAEASLAERETLLSTIIDTEPDCVKLVDADGLLVQMNPAGLAMIEADSFERVAGKPISQIVTEGHRPEFENLMAGVFRGESGTLEFEIVGLKGTHRWLETHAVPLRNPQGEIVAALGMTSDVTERKRAEATVQESLDLLRRSDQQRRRLLSRLIAAQEEERRRIASDIHDDSIQKMTAVELRLETLRRRLEHLEDPGPMDALDRVQHDVRAAIGRLRHLLFELRPEALDREGLAAALRQCLALLREQDEGPAWELDDRLAAEPPPEVRAVAYRVALEAFTNVRKHARAENIRVKLESREGGVWASISDDGVGLPAETAGEPRLGHLGVAAMRERAELAGGWLRVSGGSSGTTVEYWLPEQLATG